MMQKNRLLIVSVLLICLLIAGVSYFFFVHTNNPYWVFPGDKQTGWLYSDGAMAQIKSMVESRNQELATAPLPKTYYSKFQARGHFVEFEGETVKEPEKDLAGGMSLEDFLIKYPSAKVARNQVFVRDIRLGNSPEDKAMIDVFTFPFKDRESCRLSFWMSPDSFPKKVQGTVLSDSLLGFGTGVNVLKAIFFTTDFGQQKLPEPIARKIMYADGMLDTTQEVSPRRREAGYLKLPKNYSSLPLNEKRVLLDSARNLRIASCFPSDPGQGMHARVIAILAAETGEWEIWLRAHLKIMGSGIPLPENELFENPVAYAHLRELEAANIRVFDLFIGMILRVENPSKGRFLAFAGLLAPAFLEVEDQDQLAWEFVELISAEGLDDYNRLVVTRVFLEYTNLLEDEERKEQHLTQLKASLKMLPSHVAALIGAELEEVDRPGSKPPE